MTIDDGKSIYVGGLSYDSSEDTLRKAFEEYGEIAEVKVFYAINGMDGRTIDGRTIKVDEVKNRLSKAIGREGNFRWRGGDFRHDKGQDRLGRSRHFSPLHKRRTSPNNFRSVRGRSPPRRRSRSPRKGFTARSRTPSRERRRTHSRSSPSHASSERLQKNERIKEMSADPSKGGGRGSKESKEKSSHYMKQMKEDLEKAILKREELQNQISNLENESDNDKQTILDLQNKGQKLQELLVNATTAASNRRSQLRKFQKVVLEVRECKRKLKASEKELEALLETALEDFEAAEVEARDDRYELYGNSDIGFEEREINEIQSPKAMSKER